MKIELFKNREFSWRSVFDNLVELNLLLAIFLTPIIFSTILRTENVFELNKIFVLRILLVFLFSATLIREIFFPAKLWKDIFILFRKFWLIPSLFILGLAISLLFSGNLLLSFFGAIDRQQGFLSYLVYFLYFILISFNIFVFRERGNEKLTTKIFFAIFLSGFLVSLYGLLQFFGIDYYSWGEAALYTRRSFSFLGQPNFFASFVLLVLPIPIYFFLRVKNFLLKSFFLIGFLIILSGIITSASRGALVALVFSLFIFLFYFFFKANLKINQKKKIIIVALAFFIVALFSLALEFSLDNRLSSLFNLKEGSTSARVDFYKASLLAISEKPIFGYGQDNLYGAFLPHYQSSWGVHGRVGQVPDRAHNLLLDILMSSGFFGLIFYLGLYGFFFYLIYNLIKLKKYFKEVLILAFGTVSYLLSLLFSFSVVSTEFYFFVYLALLVIFYYDSKDVDLGLDNKENLEKKQDLEDIENISLMTKISSIRKAGLSTKLDSLTLKIFLTILILILASFFIFKSIRVYLADYYFAGSRQALIDGKMSESLTFLDYVDEQNVNKINKASYAIISSDWFLNYYPFKEELALNFLIKERLEISLNNLSDLEPQDLLFKIKILIAFEELEKAEIYLVDFRKKYPLWPAGILLEGKLNLMLDKKEEAIKTYKFFLETLPETSDPALNQEHLKVVKSFRKEAFVRIAGAYEDKLNYLEAEKYYRLAYLEDPLDHRLLKKIADLLYLQEDFEKALELVLEGMKLSINDYTWPLLASYLFEELDKKEEANYYKEMATNLGF